MNFARKNVRFVWVLLLAAVCMLLFAAPALAAEDPVEFSIEITPQSMTAPGDIQVSLRVANTSDQDMIDPVTLYDPAGNVVTGFGDGGSYILAAGSFRTWEGTWAVTQEQLNAGEFAYQVKYHIEDENGDLVEMSRMAVARVEFTGERAALEVTRTITPEVVRSGGTATVVYELYNAGNVDLNNVRVKENISRNAQTVKSLAPGEKQSLTFTSRIGNADITSSAEITYKAEGAADSTTQKIDEKVIPLAKPNLKITLSSPSTGVNIGEAATLVITFANEGNITYSNVTVKDEKQGEILTNLTIPANTTVTEEREFILTEPTTFKVSATLPDNTGNTNTLNAADELTIGVFDPEKSMLLSLNLTCDQETIHQTPADVHFTLTVTNNSNVKAEKIAITHGDTAITTIAELEPGASTVIERDARISQAGKFRFTASVKDSMQNTVTFDSNTLQITYAAPTAAPTEVAIVTVAPPVLVTAAPADAVLGQARSAFGTAALALGALFAVCAVLFLAGSGVRLYKAIRRKNAYDHFELAERRDYTEPAQDYDDEAGESAPEEEYREEPLDVEGLPHERMMHDPDEAPILRAPKAESMPEGDGEGGYRISRSEAETEAKPEETAPEKDEPAAEETPAKEEPVEETPAPETPDEEVAPAHRRRRAARRTRKVEDDEE